MKRRRKVRKLGDEALKIVEIVKEASSNNKKLTSDEILARFEKTVKKITKNGLYFHLRKLTKRGCVLTSKKGRNYVYFVPVGPGIAKKKGQPVPVKAKKGKGEPDSILEKVKSFTLEQWNVLLKGVFPGEAIVPVHIEEFKKLVVKHENLIYTLSVLGIIPSGKEELEKCREAAQMLKTRVEQLLAELEKATTDFNEGNDRIKTLEEKLLVANDTIKRLENDAKKVRNSRVHDGALVVHGEK